MTMEYMKVGVEAWVLGADPAGIWLVSDEDAWRPAMPVPADSEPHAEVELLLASHHALDPLVLLHSTSWRPDQQMVVLTYIAVVGHSGELVLDDWPNATPLSPALAAAVGRAPRHAATDPPVTRYIDVLLHAVRHLRFLDDTDADIHSTLSADWHRHLAGFAPALAGMYGTLR